MRLTATLLRFGEDSSPDVFGDVATFAPGSLYTDERQRVALLVEHNRDAGAIGYADRVWVEKDGTVRGDFTLLDTPHAQQYAAELEAGVRWDVSVGVHPDRITYSQLEDAEPHPVLGPPIRATIELADLAETSLCLRGRMPSAQVDAVSTDNDPSEGEPA